MSGDDRLSAWLDDELGPDERAQLAVELEADPTLATELEELERVRSILRSAAGVAPRPGAIERIVVTVRGADGRPVTGSLDPVVPLAARRRVPAAAAIAAAVVIVVSVVTGVGGSTMLPAIGDLVARHDAAAADDMPADVEPMPMDDMDGVGPSMPADLSMTGAYHDDTGMVHLVYRDAGGAVLSVFRQDGETDVDELPAGEIADMAGTAVWTSVVDDVHVAVVDGDGYVWTVVGDDHDTMMVAMTDDMPRRDPSLIDRLRDAADAVVRPWRLG